MLSFILGAMIGSFLNVVIVRTPNNESIITPRSHCPKCNQKIPFYYNIPILSYIILNGRKLDRDSAKMFRSILGGLNGYLGVVGGYPNDPWPAGSSSSTVDRYPNRSAFLKWWTRNRGMERARMHAAEAGKTPWVGDSSRQSIMRVERHWYRSNTLPSAPNNRKNDWKPIETPRQNRGAKSSLFRPFNI